MYSQRIRISAVQRITQLFSHGAPFRIGCDMVPTRPLTVYMGERIKSVMVHKSQNLSSLHLCSCQLHLRPLGTRAPTGTSARTRFFKLTNPPLSPADLPVGQGILARRVSDEVPALTTETLVKSRPISDRLPVKSRPTSPQGRASYAPIHDRIPCQVAVHLWSSLIGIHLPYLL